MKKNLFFKIFFLAFLTTAFSSFAGKNGIDRNGHFVLPSNITADDYIPNKIVLKVKPQFRTLLTENLIAVSGVQEAFNDLGIASMERKFPHASAPETAYNSWGAKMADITIIYNVQYSAKVDIASAINRLLSTGAFEYVEPWYLQHVHLYTPNDPNFGNAGQYFIRKIKADSAWDPLFGNERGDPTVVIGIVDTGTDPTHPDLAANMVPGWNVADNDSLVIVTGQVHGVYTSGDADAVTNNGVGVASPGYNCKFMPVKSTMSTNTTSIDHGYEGIQYAADHGVKVINCSWGGTGFSQAGQDVITYATINKDALCVCSAGNNNTNVIQFPAGYNYVLNVAATDNADAKASFSSFGPWVTISAPGNGIYSTNYNTTSKTHSYLAVSGTSMASPITAGAAALVRSKFPAYNAMQTSAQLRATADYIDGLAANVAYAGQLGTGRVNVYRAVTSTTSKSVDMINIQSTDNNDNVYVIGDTLRIWGHVVNYLSPTSNLVVTMSSASPNVQVIAPTTFNVGALTTMGVDSNSLSPFQAIIKPGTPLNTSVTFTFTLTDGSYTSTASYTVLVNVDYLNITVNDISTTVTSKGNMAYNDPDLTTRAQGLGFYYKDSSMTYEIGFMAGTDASHVSDYVRQGGTVQTTDASFQSVSNVVRIRPSTIADFESVGQFNDNASGSPLGLLVKQRTFAWTPVPDNKYVICQYIIHNTSASAYTNFYAGIFADWDVGAGGVPDLGAVDKTINLGYVWHNVPTGQYAGTKLLTHGPFNHYAIDNDSTGCTGVHIYISYSMAEKYTTLSTPKDNAGGCGASDVANVVSSGPFTVNAGDSLVVAFALLAGDNLTDLKSTAGAAQIKYDGVLAGIEELPQMATVFGLQSAVPNPSSGITTFHFSIASAAATELAIYDIAGQKVSTLLSDKMSAGVYQYTADLSKLQAGIYFYRLQSGDKSAAGKLTIVH